MIDPTVRDCAMGLMLAAVHKTPYGAVNIAHGLEGPTSATAILRGGATASKARQLVRDLRALHVPAKIDGGFAEPEVRVFARFH